MRVFKARETITVLVRRKRKPVNMALIAFYATMTESVQVEIYMFYKYLSKFQEIMIIM